MKLNEYKQIVEKYSKKEEKIKNVFISFIVGGFIGLIGEIFVRFLEVNLYAFK